MRLWVLRPIDVRGDDERLLLRRHEVRFVTPLDLVPVASGLPSVLHEDVPIITLEVVAVTLQNAFRHAKAVHSEAGAVTLRVVVGSFDSLFVVAMVETWNGRTS